MCRGTRDNRALAAKNVNSEMEKPIDFWHRKGKAVGETKPTERQEGRTEVTTTLHGVSIRFQWMLNGC